MSTAVPFTFHEQRTRSLAEIASDLGARFVHDGLATWMPTAVACSRATGTSSPTTRS